MEKLAEEYFEITVQRVGNVESGYAVRIAVCLLSFMACKSNKRAFVSFMGCGIVWSIVELAIAVFGNRVGLMTLSGRMRYAAALVRGFSEGAAVAGCALVPYSYYTLAAAAIILFDAAVVYEGAMFVSKRVVYSSTSKAYIGTLLVSAIWCFWRPKKGAYPADAMWLMTAFGFAWNAFAMMSGARVVTPESYTLAFALYDALFEIGLLYAALSQIALYLVEVVWEDIGEPEKVASDASVTKSAETSAAAEDLRSFKAQLFAEANPWKNENKQNQEKPDSIFPLSSSLARKPFEELAQWAPNGRPRSRGSSDESNSRSKNYRTLSEEERGADTFKHPSWYPRNMLK